MDTPVHAIHAIHAVFTCAGISKNKCAKVF